jgi:hypothetical protein
MQRRHERVQGKGGGGGGREREREAETQTYGTCLGFGVYVWF